MKTRNHHLLTRFGGASCAAWATLALLSTFNLQLSTAFAQGAAFTYQGRLNAGGSPANGTYNLTFLLFDPLGEAIAGPVTNNAVVVTNGLFTVLVDFGPGVFTGQTCWLEIGVETNGADNFSTLGPRQQITPTPYAILASGVSGTLSSAQLTSIGNTNGGYLYNFFVGPSGNATTAGSDNTANGAYALAANTSGSDNTANGAFALRANMGGSENTANGSLALEFNTNGSFNTAYGSGALVANKSGSGNTANGFDALFFNTSGSYNIALGYLAGYNITTGSSNIDIGNSGFSTDTNLIRIGSGQSQTFIAGVINGNGGGLINLNAAQLTSIGNTNGGYNYNFFVGPSGNSTTSGGGNTASGVDALNANTSGGGNTANGTEALSSNTTGTGNTANGLYALLFNTNGSYNTANGAEALGLNTSGSDNIALGYWAGYNITTGSSNIDIGNQGFATDTNIIRIGSGQSQTFIAGVINGNGAGLTNLNNVSAGVLSLTGGGGVTVSAASGDVTLNTVAGGDVSGSVNVATVVGLKGTPLGNLGGASPGQMLAWSGTNWVPTTPTNVAAETTRAEAAESTLSGNLNAETTRAQAAEATLTMSLNNETTRAQAAEATLNGNLIGEISRAEAAETTLMTSLNNETTRAEAAESTLSGNLSAETTRAEAAEVTLQSNLNGAALRAGGNTFTGTNTFTQPLTVSNDLAATGLTHFGMGTGTAESPTAGLIVRRINSTVTTSNSVIARSDALTLIRDGSNGGLMISYPASPGTQTIAAVGITSAGVQVNFYTTLANPGTAGTVQIYSNAQAVHSCQITFGNTYLEGHVTQVNISRALNDNFWVGTVNSTYNQ